MYEYRTKEVVMVSSTNSAVMDVLVEQLAFVRGIAVDALRLEITEGGGDLEIDSKVGQAVAALAEIALDMEGAIRPEDQNRQNLTSLRSLEQLIRTRQVEREGAVRDG
jgi:hypothetical protein